MPDEALKPAIRAVLRMHEIGHDTPYKLSFAAKARSGASFGFMQGDLAAKQPVVTKTFSNVLQARGYAATAIKSLTRRLSVHLVSNPLTKEETDGIDAALQAESALVDAMDEAIIADVYAGLDKCVVAGASAKREVDPRAQLYVALWINMSGPPTKLVTWLTGGEPHLARPVQAPGAVVTGLQMEAYLRATSYYVANPGNLPHLLASVAAGAALLPGEGARPRMVALAAAPTSYALPQDTTDHLVYEQATGRMLAYQRGAYDSLAVGYSGSLSRHAKNDPDQQCLKGAGPIPRGAYTVGAPRPGPSPYSLPLTPDPSNDMCGRSGFLIHGDSISHPGAASDGCIILTRAERQAVVATGLSRLVVVDRASA